jgi:hypothetical protein
MIQLGATGELKMKVDTDREVVFPVGTGSTYSPVTATTSDVTTPGYIAVKTTGEKHPQNPSASDYLKRYWEVSPGAVDGNVSLDFGFDPAIDVEGDLDNIYAVRLRGTGPNWDILPKAGNGTLTGLSGYGVYTGAYAAPSVSIKDDPSDIDFGEVINSITKEESITILGVDLSDDIEISATTANYTFSQASNGTYNPTLTLTPDASNAVNQEIFVRFTPGAGDEEQLDATLNMDCGDLSSVTLPLIGKRIYPTPEITLSEVSLDFASVVTGETDIRSYTVSSALYLRDNLTISAPEGFTLSTEQEGTYESVITLTPTDGAIESTIVYVQFDPTDIKDYSGNITHASVDLNETIAISGAGIVVPSLEVSVSDLDFGDVQIGDASTMSFTVSASDLIGDVILTVPSDAYTLSLSEFGSYSSSVTIDKGNGTLCDVEVFVDFAPLAVQAYTGVLTVETSTTQSTINADLNLIASGIDGTYKKEILPAQTSVYPVPSNGFFSVQLPLQSGSAIITITDISGSIVEMREAVSEKEEFNFTGKAKGVYLIHIRQADTYTVQKLIIK